ncbi:MAG: very-short-patch-repair endonuclease [Gammaproteobacteria bacterium]|jgi:very-short-patch-repair endonuclease
MDVLYNLEKASSLHDSIVPLSEPFEEDNIWQGWETTPDSLSDAAKRGKAAYKALADIIGLTDDPAVVLTAVKSKLIDGRDFLDSSKLINHRNEFKKRWDAYVSVAAETVKLELDFSESDAYEQVVPAIDLLISSAVKFKSWSEWLAVKETAKAYQLNTLTTGLEARTILPEDAEDQVFTAFCRWVAPQLIDECDQLREFKASTHEQLITEFRQIDAEVAQTTSAYVAAIAAQTVPDPFAKDSPKEYGVLARELQKKTRHKPVRSLFNEMGSRLLDLCPCMMMSPLSVAQFLPSGFNGFDLVVFDEASQMTTWDSVGAIARGKNVIVVGDPKQMPPTSFFSGGVNVDDPDEEDLESILDQALAARLPHLRLKGHYRSRHETLIAFSNSKYYENSLMTYPSSDTKESAVTLHRVEGIYSKGKGRNNPIEAKAVVNEIVKRLTNPESCKQSIGVVTLNTDQQRTIEDLLDDARREHHEIETYFKSTDTYDGVFVKNLESVQGDERDIIILSLAYGPTEAGGRAMSMNFGPLNKSGGERRLNVAITRATSEVLVFSSFDSSMIDLSRTSALAVEHLKHYLEFAEKGPVALSEQSTAAYGVDQFDSDFEQAVAWALRDKGWKVQTQIGVSKFRVDLGVIHPDFPGVYLAGIECDGATYHGSPSARDRDRVRQLILENLGWRLVRLWSTDYFQDPDEAISRIDRRLNDILAVDRTKAELKEDIVPVEVQEEPEADNILYNVNSESYSEQSEAEIKISESLPNSVTGAYDHSRYFDHNYKPTLIKIAKDILEEKNGITLHELALDIANLHGLSRTSKKQMKHIIALVKPWAGLVRDGVHKPIVWSRPEDIVDEIPWRGLNAFGYERDWTEIPYAEAKGLARVAIQQSPSSPVNYICEVFKLKRRFEKTLEQFQLWVDDVKAV